MRLAAIWRFQFPGRCTVHRSAKRLPGGRCALTLGLALGLVVTGSGGASALALTPPGPAVLLDADGHTHYQSMADRPWYPASLTKLMVLLLAFDALDRGELREHDALSVSIHAAGQPPTRLGLRAGTHISTGDAIRSVITISANDAAVVLAEAMAGSETRFVAKMNRKAGRLGLARTRFTNATGLPGGAQQTTAADMGRLALHLLRNFPHHYHRLSAPGIEVAGRWRGNHNRLLQHLSGADGMKTGFTCDAGYNIVASAKRQSRRLIAVVLGAKRRALRDRFAARLLEAGFARGPIPAPPALVTEAGRAPPMRLGERECRPARIATVTRASGLHGWGIFLGNFVERSEARAPIARALRAARKPGEVARGSGRGAVLERSLAKGSSWKALVVGLTAEQAGGTCRRLRAAGGLCIAQSPQRLKMTGYPEQ